MERAQKHHVNQFVYELLPFMYISLGVAALLSPTMTLWLESTEVLIEGGAMLRFSGLMWLVIGALVGYARLTARGFLR